MGFDVTQLRQDMCTIDPNDSQGYLKWGKLVKTWVTGINQFNDNNNYSIPSTGDTVRLLGAMTSDQFQDVLQNANVEMSVPDNVAKFVFVQDDDATVIVRLPSKKVVEDVQHLLEGLIASHTDFNKAEYPLPEFYQELWQLVTPRAMNREEILDVHCQRIGEYTINTCG